MSGSNIAVGYTTEEGADVWGRIGSFGKIYNKFAEESGCVPSGKAVERILAAVGAVANIPTISRNCSFPECKKTLSSYNNVMLCGSCQSLLIDEENSPKKSKLLSFLRQESPKLFGRVLGVIPWKLTPVG